MHPSRRGGDIISKVTNADYWDLEHCATLGAPRSPHSPQLSLDGVLDRRRCGPRRRSAHHPHGPAPASASDAVQQHQPPQGEFSTRNDGTLTPTLRHATDSWHGCTAVTQRIETRHRKMPANLEIPHLHLHKSSLNPGNCSLSQTASISPCQGCLFQRRAGLHLPV